MLKQNVRPILLGLLGVALVSSLSILGCGGQGNTEGEATNSANADGFVSDGAAGSTLSLSVTKSLGVGATATFLVTATDSTGAPLPFIRIFCESESGIAIIEPSSGGTAFESTNSGGIMSGVIGGLTPGSYLLECRGPQGFNLIARETIGITGTVPAGFAGFPGAAGGNLGGGFLVDDILDVDDGAVIITGFSFTDAGETVTAGPIDITRNSDCDGMGTPEPFTFNNYSLALKNNASERVTITSVTFSIADGRPASTSTQSTTVSIDSGGTGTVSGIFTEFVSGTAIKTFAGSSFTVLLGTYPVTATVTGVTEAGDTFTITGSQTVTFGSVDRCASS